MWLQAYGAYGDQGERKGIDGYDSRTHGLTLGIDAQTDHIDTVGAFFNYANSKVDSDGIGNDKLDIGNYSLGVYGAQNFGQAYVEAMGSVGFNDYSGKRVTIGNEVASRDYDGMQYAINLETGYSYDVADGLLFTPRVGLQYTQIEDNNYREKGAAAALKVESRSSKSLRSAIGFDGAYTISTTDGPIYTALLSGTWKHELMNGSSDVKASFVNSGAAPFASGKGKSADHSFDLGIGMDVAFDDISSLSFGYNLELKDKFDGHGGQIKYKYKF